MIRRPPRSTRTDTLFPDTTLFRSSGDGINRDAGARNAGLVFQSYALWPHMTVTGNIDWPLKVARWRAARRRTRVEEVLGMLGIGDLAGRYPKDRKSTRLNSSH